MPTPTIRAATLTDVAGLLALETGSFASDRLPARSVRHFVRAPTAALRVVPAGAGIAAYYLILFRGRSRVARLYSIAVDGAARGRGLATALLADAESVACQRGAERIGLEVREDNPAAIRLYERLGYGFTGRVPDYYEDGAAARRYEKRLDPRAARRSPRADD